MSESKIHLRELNEIKEPKPNKKLILRRLPNHIINKLYSKNYLITKEAKSEMRENLNRSFKRMTAVSIQFYAHSLAFFRF